MEGAMHMPNYRYNTPDYMRRNYSCGCQQEQRQASAERRTMRDTPRCDEQKKCDSLSEMPLAMAYVPWQEWRAIYDVEKGFRCGTIFEELNKPFKGGCC